MLEIVRRKSTLIEREITLRIVIKGTDKETLDEFVGAVVAELSANDAADIPADEIIACIKSVEVV